MEAVLVDKALEVAKKVCVSNQDCFGPFKLDTYCFTFQCCNLFEYVNHGGNPIIENNDFSPSILPYIALIFIFGVLFLLTCCCFCCKMCCCRKTKEYVIFRNPCK